MKLYLTGKFSFGKDADTFTFIDKSLFESDRAAAIIGAERISYQLTKLLNILSFTIKNKRHDVFQKFSLSDKINVCYRLGLFDEEDIKLLLSINKIRNKFAHEINITNIDHTHIKKLIKEIEELIDRFEIEKEYKSLKKYIKKEYLSEILSPNKTGKNIFKSVSTLSITYRTFLAFTIRRIDDLCLKVKPDSISFEYK